MKNLIFVHEFQLGINNFKSRLMKIVFVLFLVFNTFAMYSQVITSRIIKAPNHNLTIYGSIEAGDNLFLYGITGNESTGDNPFIIKMQSNGDILWAKAYSSTNNILIRSACLNEENGLTLIGNSMTYNNDDIVILKTNHEGTLDWAKKYGGNDQERGFQIIKLDDNSYVTCGSTRSFSSGEEDAFVMRIDAYGNKIWDRIMGGTNRDNAFDVTYSNDRTLVITGPQSSLGSGEYDFGLTKLDLDGELIFFKTIGSYNQDHSRVVHQVKDGGYVILGHTNDNFGRYDLWNILLIKTNIDGKVEWSKRYSTGKENYTGDFIELSNGFMLTGSTLNTGERNLFALKTDFNGIIEWGTLFDIPDFQEFSFGAKGTCVSTGADQYRAVGRTQSAGKSAGLLLSFSSEQNELCYEMDYTPFSKNLTLSSHDNTGLIGISQGFGSSDISFIQKPLSIEHEVLCLPESNVLFESDKQNICEGECITFTDLSSNMSDTLAWSFEGGVPSISSEKNPSICYPMAGKFSVSLKIKIADDFEELTVNDYITVYPPPDFSLGNDLTLCDSEGILLIAQGYDSVTWQDGSNRNHFNASVSGYYNATVYDSKGCFSSDTVLITFANSPDFSLGKDSTFCDSEQILLTAEGYESVIWQDGSIENYFIAETPGFYHATVYNSEGCFSSDTIFISVCCDYSLSFPNVFTPNNDGYNDFFKPTISNVLNYSMLIINRWGVELFSTNDQDKAWDGKYKGNPCSQGVYFVIINFDACNEYGIYENKTEYGSVTLIR